MSYIAGVTTIIQQGLINNGRTLQGEANCGDIQLKGKYVILQLDGQQFKENVINTICTPGNQRCICDYVIISEEVILVCELKSGNEGRMKIQLKNTGKFIKYILEMVREHNRIVAEIPPIKYVCFSAIKGVTKQVAKSAKLEGINWQNTMLYRLSCNSFYYLNQFN